MNWFAFCSACCDVFPEWKVSSAMTTRTTTMMPVTM